MSELPGAAPATDHDEGSPRVLISGLNRTAFDLAVYASQWWSPTRHARLASGCWSGSTGRDWLPAGFHLKGFKLRLSSSPELLGAMSVHHSCPHAEIRCPEIRCQSIILARMRKSGVSPSFLPEKMNRHRITRTARRFARTSRFWKPRSNRTERGNPVSVHHSCPKR